jgi:putative peptidoglycan lipid II flippase
LVALGVTPLVELFGFDQAGSALVVWTARAFLLGLVGHTLLEIGARGFYAQQDAITPLLASVLMAGTFTLLAIGLARPFGAAGIALANSIAFSGEALLLLFLLNRKFPGLLKLGRTLPRVIAATLVGGIVTALLLAFLPLPPIIAAIAALGMGALAVLPFIWPEIKTLATL